LTGIPSTCNFPRCDAGLKTDVMFGYSIVFVCQDSCWETSVKQISSQSPGSLQSLGTANVRACDFPWS